MSVQPQQLDDLLAEITVGLDERRHRLISVVTGVSIAQIRIRVGGRVPIVLAMPVGRTLVIQEEMMAPATALCACGVAFFLRCIRAASQGGIEIGFHPEEALLLAGQTARGAASLSLREGSHPEGEIDRVTTPRGCTIVGLNEMEHRGLSSALIKGLIVSARAAEGLYAE
jgi:pyrroline-5-carboxylate reductase